MEKRHGNGVYEYEPAPPSAGIKFPTSRVDPRFPLPNTQGPVYPEDVQNNVTGRTSSRRRKLSGATQATGHESLEPPPMAPDVPRASKGPPLAYRGPYNDDEVLPQRKNSRSLSARIAPALNSLDPTLANAYAARHMPTVDSQGSPRQINAYGGASIHYTADRQTEDSPYSSLNSALTPSRKSDAVPNEQSHKDPVQAEELPTTSHQSKKQDITSAVILPSTTHTIPDSKQDWAYDRSPLQTLEVKLNDISKEEKRARLQEAEQLLREGRAPASSRRASQAIEPGISQASSRRVSSMDQSEGLVSQGVRPSKHEMSATANYGDPSQESVRSEGRGKRISSTSSNRQSWGRPSSRIVNQPGEQPSTASGSRRRSIDDRGVRFHSDVGDMSKDSAQKNHLSKHIPPQQQHLYGERTRRKHGEDSTADPVAGYVARGNGPGAKFQTPPQSAGGIEARQFGGRPYESASEPPDQKKHLLDYFHRNQGRQTSQTAETMAGTLKHRNEWREGGVARLMLDDPSNKSDKSIGLKKGAWWDSPRSTAQRNGRYSQSIDTSDGDYDGVQEGLNVPTTFDPPLLLKCGPLLRYTGLKREKFGHRNGRGAPSSTEQEIWRGSVMIATIDCSSHYEPAPLLRLFHQPINALPPPPHHFDGDNDDGLPSEYVDPIGGLPKMTRDGSTVYVRPVEDLEEGKDVSRDEDDDGLFEATRTANVPTAYGKADEFPERGPFTTMGRNRKGSVPPGRSCEVKGVCLHAERDVTFWRFNLEVELGDKEARIAYRINNAASIGFWVPGRGQTMNIMFHSCNGFSTSVDPNQFSGPDPLWRDVLNAHQTRPFHVMIGGGDQIYNDAVMRQTKLFQEWLTIKNPHHKSHAEFTPDMREELECFYLERYSMWFSQGLFGMANAQIPMINIWDDHDILDGYGSYPHHFMSTPVFRGLGNVAFKYYMLFQHQSVADETAADEPSWLLGASPGPYIHERSRSVFMSLGKHVAFLGLDCRTERTREEVMGEESYDLIFDRCRAEIEYGVTKHLIVLLSVPIAYPRLVWLENILTSRAMDPLKALGRMGMLSNFMNKFDGGVEIVDDLDDHWTAHNHKGERNWLVRELQDLAAEKSVRITILGGDVHLAAIGQFYTNKKHKVPKDRDHRYMPNIISSAIVNTPPPDMMADILNKRDKVHHLDHDTDEDMIPMFTHDVDGKIRNNKRLLPRRNWCSITEYKPGSTPPPTPPSTSPSASEMSSTQQRPTAMRRTLSLTRGDSRPAKLLRRMSLGQRKPESPDLGGSVPYDQITGRPPYPKPARPTAPPRNYSTPLPIRPVSQFHRRPTNLSEMAAEKGGNDQGGEISLENGLDVRLNCEIKQGDPSGSTESYRLLVPALRYVSDVGNAHGQQHRQSLVRRFSLRRGSRTPAAARQGSGEYGASESESESESGSGSGSGSGSRRGSDSEEEEEEYAGASQLRRPLPPGKGARRQTAATRRQQPQALARSTSLRTGQPRAQTEYFQPRPAAQYRSVPDSPAQERGSTGANGGPARLTRYDGADSADSAEDASSVEEMRARRKKVTDVFGVDPAAGDPAAGVPMASRQKGGEGYGGIGAYRGSKKWWKLGRPRRVGSGP